MGRELQRTLPGGASESKTYDAGGNVSARTDFMGRTTTYAYDVNDRLTTKVFPSGPPVSFTYSATGRRLTATDARGVTSYTYDGRDRLLSKQDPNGNRVEYTWDSGGRLGGLTARVGGFVKTTGYGYDVAGRMNTVTDPDGRVFGFAHDANGMPTRLTRPNGVDTEWVHDDRNRLLQVRTYGRVSNATIASYIYALSPSGQRTAILEADGTLRSYGYDALNRLTSENVSGGTGPSYEKTFGYDAVSNRTSQVTTGYAAGSVAYTYDARQRLLTENSASYAWDLNGNQVSKSGGDTYQWDFEDRLVRVVKADGTVVDSTYDVDGVLVRMVVTPVGGGAAVATDFVVDTAGGLSQVLAEVRGGVVDALYVRAGDMLLSEIRGSDVRYPEAEGIGSVRSLTDATGAQTDTWRYTAFGEEVARSGTDAFPYQFAGERNVAAVGLYQNRARWLSTGVGAFVSVDPLERDTQVAYRYAESNPSRMTDPTGAFSVGEAGMVVAIIGAVSVLPDFAGFGRVASANGVQNRLTAHLLQGDVISGRDDGRYRWPVSWSLSRPSAAGGWVVQHMKVTRKLLVNGIKDVRRYNYSEAWEVLRLHRNAINPPPAVDVHWNDTWEYPVSNAPSGSVKWTGTARFYEGRTQQQLERAGFKFPSNPDPKCAAGILPCKLGPPGLSYDNATPPLNREKENTWP